MQIRKMIGYMALGVGMFFWGTFGSLLEQAVAEEREGASEIFLTPEGTAASGMEVTSEDGAEFNSKDSRAIFIGNVQVKDARFNLRCDKLTVYLGAEGSGLERATAEGNVLIVQDKLEEGAKKATRSTGKAMKADYNPKTGDIVLTGWPEIRQGINIHRATAFSTKMILNRDGRMKTEGPSITLIQEQEGATNASRR